MISSTHKIKKSPKSQLKKKRNFNFDLSFDAPSIMRLSNFCLKEGIIDILNPFATFSQLPEQFKLVLSNFPHFNFTNIEINNAIIELNQTNNSNSEENLIKNELEMMKSVGMSQEIMIEKWMWNKYNLMKKDEDLNFFMLYKQAKNCIEIAFDEFFWKKQQNFQINKYFLFIYFFKFFNLLFQL